MKNNKNNCKNVDCKNVDLKNVDCKNVDCKNVDCINVDRSTRSRSIKFSWAVRLLVFLLMLTTILASFVVPASAADPFSGSKVLYINDLNRINYWAYTSGTAYHNIAVSNGFQDGLIIYNDPLNIMTVSDGKIKFFNPSANFRCIFNFTFDRIKPEDFPFKSCNLPITIDSNNDNVIPAGVDIPAYLADNIDLFNPLNGEVYVGQVIRVVGDGAQQSDWTAVAPYCEIELSSGKYRIEIDGGIQSVFDLIGSWLSNTFNTLGGVFFDNGSLTVLGGLAVGSLGVSVILLLIKVISNFIRFRG